MLLSEKDILSLKSVDQLKCLAQTDIGDRSFSEREVDHILRVTGAAWTHSGVFSDPHAELTSDKCSNGFVDVLRALHLANICDIMGYQLSRKWNDQWSDHIPRPGWVVGSDHAGATLSYGVAKWLGAKHDFTEKGPDKTQLWKHFVIEPDEEVLQVEELITTTGTLQAVRDGIRQGNPKPVIFSPVVMTLVHRSDVYEIEYSPIRYLVHYDIKVWEPSECPLCAAGSERIRPKQNWAKLTGQA